MKLLLRIHLLGTLLFSLLFFSCSQSKSLWPLENITLVATYYELNVADTAKFLIPDGASYQVLDVTDSLVVKKDTVFYRVVQGGVSPYFEDVLLQTVKTNASNPSIKEFYTMEHGAVKLVGYATGDSLNPATKFKEPLVILPRMTDKVDSSVTVMQNWNNIEQRFDDATKIKTVVRLLQQGEMKNDGQTETFYLYQITLTGDAMVGYGDRQLIMPDAILMQSKFLYSSINGLMCEWSLKTKRTRGDGMRQAEELTVPEIYVEFINYHKR